MVVDDDKSTEQLSSIWDVKLLESALCPRSGEGLGGRLEDPNYILAEFFLLSFAPPSGRNVSFD